MIERPIEPSNESGAVANVVASLKADLALWTKRQPKHIRGISRMLGEQLQELAANPENKVTREIVAAQVALLAEECRMERLKEITG